MADAQGAGNASGATNPAAGPNLSLISTQLSWMRSDLSNLRTLLAWARTSVAMIGFGFTIYNFYRGFFERLVTEGRADAARNLGLALVAAGTLAMVVGVVNYRGIATSLIAMDADLEIAAQFKRRWVYSYALSGVVMVIGLITLLFMLRVS